MNNKLVCPFCGEELRFAATDVVWYCRKHGFLSGNEKLWQALIQAKQDLEIARKALKPFADRNNWDFEHCFVDNPQLLAGTALEQITHDNSEKANSVEHKE